MEDETLVLILKAIDEASATLEKIELKMGKLPKEKTTTVRVKDESSGGISSHRAAFGKWAKDTEGDLTNLTRAAGRATGMFSGLYGGGGATLAAAAAGGIGAEAVKDAVSYNVAIGQVANAQKDAGASFSLTKEQVDQATSSMANLGFKETDILGVIAKMTEAHIPLNDQLKTLMEGANLAAAKNETLGEAFDALDKAAQGSGRGLKDYALNLPAAIEGAKQLDNAQKSLAKAQQTAGDNLAKYGDGYKNQAKDQEAIAVAQQKVDKITQDQANHFGGLANVLDQVGGKLDGAAQQAANDDPWKVLNVQIEKLLINIGQQLLPYVQQFTNWFISHLPEISSVAKTVIDAIIGFFGTMGQAIKWFVENVWPPLHQAFLDLSKWIGDHRADIDNLANSIGNLLSLAFSALKTAISAIAPILIAIGDAAAWVGNNIGWGPVLAGLVASFATWKAIVIGGEIIGFMQALPALLDSSAGKAALLAGEIGAIVAGITFIAQNWNTDSTNNAAKEFMSLGSTSKRDDEFDIAAQHNAAFSAFVYQKQQSGEGQHLKNLYEQSGLQGLQAAGYTGDTTGLSRAASGGIVPSRPGGTPVLVGEAGQSEAIIPLPSGSGGGLGLGGGTIIIDLRGSQVMSDRDMDMLITKLGYRLGTTVLPGAGISLSGR